MHDLCFIEIYKGSKGGKEEKISITVGIRKSQTASFPLAESQNSKSHFPGIKELQQQESWQGGCRTTTWLLNAQCTRVSEEKVNWRYWPLSALAFPTLSARAKA